MQKYNLLNTNLTNDLGGITNYGSYTPTATFSSLNICTITATKKGKVIILATVNSTTTRYLYLYNTTKRKNISNKNFGDGINCILAVVSVDIGDVITLYSQFSATNTVNYSVQAFYIG